MAAVPPLEIVFSFDTTGSMYGWLEEVRGRLQDLITRLQADIPSIRIAVIAHGDYTDAATYVTKMVDLTTDAATLIDFVHNVERTGGSDSPECYELVLREVRTKLSWSPGSRRVLVLIGDDLPHEADYRLNTQKIDWKEETRLLAAEAVTVYGVQCGHQRHADAFYQTISVATSGKHLRLADMTSLFDLMMAVCYREGADTSDLLTGYESEVRGRCGPMAVDIDALFASLKDAPPASATPTTLVAPKLKKAASLTKIKKPKVIAGKVSPKHKLTSASAVKPSVAPKIETKERKPCKAAKISKKPSSAFHRANLPLLKRENVPESNFALRTLSWSPWHLALVNEADLPSSTSDLYVKRKTRPGYRLKTLGGAFQKNMYKLALFEVAVQGPGPRRRLHVVFSKFSAACLRQPRWDSRLLRPVAAQVDRVLKLGFKVLVRFTPVIQRSMPTGLKAAVRRYDYAWRGCRAVRAGPRKVVKMGLHISQ